MPRVSPLQYFLQTPTRPFGVASRGASRALSAAAPMAMPAIDEYLQSPQVQQALAGMLGQGAEKLGMGSDAQELAAGAAPMVSKLAPRLAAVFGSEALAGMGGMLGAPEEMWDPAVRRESAMMMMPMEQGPGATGPLGDYSVKDPVSHQSSGGGPLAGVLGGATGAPIGQVAGAVEGMAMMPGVSGANFANSVFSSGAARRLLDAQRKTGGGGDAVDTLGQLRSVFGADPMQQNIGMQAPEGLDPAIRTHMRRTAAPDPMQGGRPAGSPPMAANAMARDLARKVAGGIEAPKAPDLVSILRQSQPQQEQPRSMEPRYMPPRAADVGDLEAPEGLDPAIRTHMRRTAAPDYLRNRGPGAGRLPAYMTRSRFGEF